MGNLNLRRGREEADVISVDSRGFPGTAWCVLCHEHRRWPGAPVEHGMCQESIFDSDIDLNLIIFVTSDNISGHVTVEKNLIEEEKESK